MSRIRVEECGAVARVWLTRAERRNAFDRAMLVEYVETLEALAADPQVRAAVVAADGKHFCAGWDTGEFAALGTADPEAALLDSYALLERAWSAEVVTVGAIRGAVAGFGVGLLHRLHLAVASTSARVVLPEITFGIAAASVLVDLQRSLPRKVALDLLLTGDGLDAGRAAQLGMFSRLVADDELDAAALALAQQVAALPQAAVQTILHSYRRAESLDARAAVAEAVRCAAQTIYALGTNTSDTPASETSAAETP